jgi:magnesium chelatase family protein
MIVGLPTLRFKNAGLNFPRRHIVDNLAAVRKKGTGYDLPVAVGVMVLAGFLHQQASGNGIVIGELSRDGMVRHDRRVLALAVTAWANGLKRMFVSRWTWAK